MTTARAPGPIGVLGGTFDPVHAGHVQLARDAQAALGLSQLRFLPAGQPWQKGPVTPAYHRLAMLTLALEEERREEHQEEHQEEQRLDALRGPAAGWAIDARETERAGPSYAVDTLRELRSELGSAVPLVWIMGFDQLERLQSWHAWESLSALAHIAYARRAGAPGELSGALADYVALRHSSPAALHAAPAGCFVEFAMQAVPCSATQIRVAVARDDKEAARAWLAPAVLDYIHSHQLYLAVHG